MRCKMNKKISRQDGGSWMRNYKNYKGPKAQIQEISISPALRASALMQSPQNRSNSVTSLHLWSSK